MDGTEDCIREGPESEVMGVHMEQEIVLKLGGGPL